MENNEGGVIYTKQYHVKNLQIIRSLFITVIVLLLKSEYKYYCEATKCRYKFKG